MHPPNSSISHTANFLFPILFLLATLVTAPLTTAQTEPPPSPCLKSEQLKQFDFWLGHWQVKLADGTIAGENTITREQNACVLVENWRGARGGSGISLNYFDQTKQRWVQIWTGSEGSQIQIEGGLENGSMVLVGKIATLGQEGSADFRGKWTLLEDGRVRQFFEQYDEEEKIWVPWFEGYYEKMGK